jgi:SAM-dependent methyltransferase
VALSSAEPQLSIVAARLQRLSDAARFLHQLQREVDALGVPSEIIAVPGDPRGFGYELREGLRQARAPYVITVDPDFSGRMTFLADLWARRDDAEVIVASRYVEGSRINMPAARTLGSRVLNSAFRRGLSVGVNDGSSAIRLYRTSVVNSLQLESTDYDILQEVLVRAHSAGWRVLEIPLDYTPNPEVASKAHAALASAYLRTFWALWKLRNSIAAADYDYRAHDSPIPLQRYWQRSRFRYISELIDGQGPVLDVGCGSSHIIGVLPRGSVALDVLINKLRFARRFPIPRVRASGFALPFADASFPCVLCSQVIEHVPMVPSMIDELCRVLRPGGRLVLGTPDYDQWQWVWIEKAYGLAAPGGYADEHISHYTRKGLLEDFARRGYAHEATRYILRGELILAFRKPA